MKRMMLCVTMLLASLLAGSLAQAYTVGNPVAAAGTGKLAVSAEYEFQDRELPGSLPTESKRYLIKASYGVTSWLDLFAKGGVAGLEIPLQGANFIGEDRFAWGAGAQAILLRVPSWRMELFSTGQVFSYRTRGQVSQVMTGYPVIWTRQLDTKYVWWEYGGALGVKYRQGFVWPYLGLDVSYVDGEKITKQHSIYSDYSQYDGQSSAQFSSDEVIFSGFLGCDVCIPSRYKLSLEVRGNGPDEVSFTIGLSQTSQ